MISHLLAAIALLICLAPVSTQAKGRDYLQRGEPKLTGDYWVKYNRAVRNVLSRGWRGDVVLRMFQQSSPQPEWVTGISRRADGYRAFGVVASHNITRALDPAWGPERRIDLHTVRPILHERAIPAPLAARVAALWRSMLADSASYGTDPAYHLHSDRFSFYMSFLPHERIMAHTIGGGPKVDQLFEVACALTSYAMGDNERILKRAVVKAERKFGI